MWFIPVFILMFAIAIILVIIGVFLIILSSMRESESGEEKKVEAGGVVIIGPLPIVFGTSKDISKAMLILAIVLTILVFILFLVTTGLTRW